MTTRWSVVLNAGDSPSPQAQEALAILCRAYWYPIYAFVRRQGHTPDDAQDLTQEFFARLLQSHFFALADRRRGRFRSFLLASVKHFLMHEWQKGQAIKRGAGERPLSLDAAAGESRYRLEPVNPVTAETLFDRRWALALLEQVLQRLRQEYETANKLPLFTALKGALTGDQALPPYTEIARQVGISQGAVKVAVHRLRQRYGQLLREEIAQTVSGPEEVEAELRCLIEALSS